MRAGTSQRYGSKAPTRAQRRARAINYVCFCTPERLAALTSEEIAGHSGLPVAEAAELLAQARQRRGG